MSYATILHIRNEEQTIKKVINAILKQTIKTDTIFVVDDESTDRTDEILHELGLNHIHFKQSEILKTYQRRASAFNKAIKEVPHDSTYILKVDGDIIIEPNYAETLLSIMKNPIIAAASGVSKNYHKTRDLNNGAVMYLRKALPEAEAVYGWDRQIQLKLMRKGYKYYVSTNTSYEDLRPPTKLKPDLLRVLANRVNKKMSYYIGIIINFFKKVHVTS